MAIEIEEVYKSEWGEWKRQKVTRALLADIMNKRDWLKEALAENKFDSDQERNINIGKCIAMREIVEYIIADFATIMDNAKEEKDKNA